MTEGPVEEGAGREQQAGDAQRPQAGPQEADERVEQHRGGVPGQQVGRHGVQVPAPDDRDDEPEQDHARGDPEPGSDQARAASSGPRRFGTQQHEADDRQPEAHLVQDVEQRPRLGDVLRPEDGDLPVHDRDPVGQGEALLQQALLDLGDQRAEVDVDLVVDHDHGA